MTTKGSQDRMLDALYAGLDQTERARLLARWARADDARELDRLRRTIPDAAAETAFNRAIRILRQLHGPMVPMLVTTETAIERDTAMLLLIAQQAARRQQAQVILQRLWTALGYPVTVGEYRLLVAAERSEPGQLAALDGAADRRHPGVATLLQRVPRADEREDWEVREGDRAAMADKVDPEEDSRPAEARFGQIRHVPAAIARGVLPTPKPTKQGLVLRYGLFAGWGEGVTPDSDEPLPPAYHIPVLELVGGTFAEWDVRPDAEQDAVVARRAALLAIASDIMTTLGLLDAGDLTGLTLEPLDGVERNQMAEQARQLWPWSHDRDRDRLQELARVHARRRAEAQAYRAVIAMLQGTEFGGEDPLDPLVRALLSELEAREAEFTVVWSAIVAALPPASREEDAANEWPPSLEDAAYLEQLRPELEAHLRGEWDG